MYREIFVPVDNSQHSRWAVDRAIQLCRQFRGRITANHVYAARLHDIRFRQLETGLPAQFQTPEEVKKQRKIHDKLIEKGLQLISDSFLDQVAKTCEAAGVAITRQLLEGINYEEIVNEVNRGGGRLPGLIGFDPNLAAGYDGGAKVRSDVRVGENGRLVAEDEDAAARLVGATGRRYDLVAMGAHGLGRQPYSQLGGVVARSLRGIEKDMLIVRDDRPFEGGRFLVAVDGSSYSYKAMRVALELARAFGAVLYVCSAFDVEYHHVVFHNIKDVLSYQASKVFKFEEQEELHNNIIDKGLLRLCQANLKRAEVMAQEFPGVPVKTQILIGKPFQVILQWAAEIEPSLLVIARHGAHRIEGTQLGSQAENLVRLASCNTLLIGTTGIRPEDIPWIEEDGQAGLPWAPEAEVRILRVPPFAQGIARRAVEEYVLEHAGGTPTTVTSKWLDEAIRKLLPTHMQLIMGIGTAEEVALAEVKATEQLKSTKVMGHDDDPEPSLAEIEVKCPVTGAVSRRPRTAADPIVWTEEAWQRLGLVPLIARPLARSTVERFARTHGVCRVTTRVMDDNKQAMIAADEFDAETMMVMFTELRARQIRAEAEGRDGLSSEGRERLSPGMRAFIEEAQAQGITRCPIRDIDAKMGKCPVDLSGMTPEAAKEAMARLLEERAAE
ncbi:MAG: universal stress protein [Candidatus Rokubacteria bacterium]|nr:universal stress protein [Candidatus Rokubacteria bacterium]